MIAEGEQDTLQSYDLVVSHMITAELNYQNSLHISTSTSIVSKFKSHCIKFTLIKYLMKYVFDFWRESTLGLEILKILFDYFIDFICIWPERLLRFKKCITFCQIKKSKKRKKITTKIIIHKKNHQTKTNVEYSY